MSQKGEGRDYRLWMERSNFAKVWIQEAVRERDASIRVTGLVV